VTLKRAFGVIQGYRTWHLSIDLAIYMNVYLFHLTWSRDTTNKQAKKQRHKSNILWILVTDFMLCPLTLGCPVIPALQDTYASC